MNKLVVPIALISLCLSLGCLIMLFKQKQKIVFVNIETVYDDFLLKKELEAKFDNVANARQQILDSLKLELNLFYKTISSNKDVEKIQAFQQKKQEYSIKEQSYLESTEQTNEQYKNQIWKQLSQYMKKFGSKNNYQYILGFENKSAVLYGDEAEDVTAEASDYINKAYKGDEK
jgi:outer membrane protein